MSELDLCALDDIPNPGCKGFTRGEQKLFAVRQGPKLFIYRNACPHLGIPLEWVEDQFLDPSGSMIQCANHGALFVINNGKCVSGPCAGQRLQPISFRLINGRVFIANA